MYATPQLALRANDRMQAERLRSLGVEASRDCLPRSSFHRLRTVGLVPVRAGNVPPMLCMRPSPWPRLSTGYLSYGEEFRENASALNWVEKKQGKAHPQSQ